MRPVWSAAPVAAAPPSVSLRTVLREWGRIGLIGFGGPRRPPTSRCCAELCVDRRGWLDAREFEDANAACGLLPGPASTQLAIYCAQRVRGLAGALTGGLAFILPGLAMILAISALALGERPPLWIRAVGAGAGAAVVAVVVQAGLVLGRSALTGRRGGALARAAAYLLAGAAATVALGAWVVLVLLTCGLLELAWRRRPAGGALAAHAAPALVLAAATGASQLPALAWTALKVGALSYGGGFVIIPLMQSNAVGAYGWMTRAEFVNAVAFGQLTPGPVVHTVAVVGWAAAGPAGALLAAAVAFAPSFLVVGLGGSRFERLRTNRGARAFLDGAGPAAVGAICWAPRCRSPPPWRSRGSSWSWPPPRSRCCCAAGRSGCWWAARWPGSPPPQPGWPSRPDLYDAAHARRPAGGGRGRPGAARALQHGQPAGRRARGDRVARRLPARGGPRGRAGGRRAGSPEPRRAPARRGPGRRGRRPGARPAEPHGHRAGQPGRVDPRPVVGRGPRRLLMGPRRDRHEVPDGRRGGRRRHPRPLRLAAGAR